MCIEEMVWNGWKKFRKVMDELWYKYESSGRAMANGELEKEDEKFREIFLKAESYENFLSMIRKYWEGNYHMVANAYNQLIRMFKELNRIKGYTLISLLPEVEGCMWGDIEGKDEVLTITESFYSSIIKRMDKHKTNQIRILSKKDNRLFVLGKRGQRTDDGNYTILYIVEEKIIKV